MSVVSGYNDDEISAMKATDFFFREDIQRVTEAIEMVVKEGYAIVEARVITKDGRHVHYEITGAMLRNPEGEPTGICGIGRDITERKRAEEELYKRGEELKKRVKELEDFYGMSIGRELRMIELKKEIESLKEELAEYKKDA